MTQGRDTENITAKVPKEEKEKWRQRSDSMSGRLARLVKAWNETEDELGVRKDVEDTTLAVLKTYRNAIEKNIQVMKAQRDKLDKQIEEFEEEEGGEILFTVELDLEGENL